jgi:hypothetical protein
MLVRLTFTVCVIQVMCGPAAHGSHKHTAKLLTPLIQSSWQACNTVN